MTNKDYSHIKQGMYFLKEEIKDEETWEAVKGAFSQEGASLTAVYLDYVDFLRDLDKYCGWDIMGDLHIPFDNEVPDVFGPDHALVSVDFILNGPKEEEKEDATKFKVGEVYQCGDVKVKIIYLNESKKHVVGIELADEGV